MGKTFKDQRDRNSRKTAGAYVDAFNQNRTSPTEETVREFSRVSVDNERKLRDHGPHDGRRYGNKRNSKAVEAVQQRRQDRRRHADPAGDVNGELGLPTAPSKARAPRF